MLKLTHLFIFEIDTNSEVGVCDKIYQCKHYMSCLCTVFKIYFTNYYHIVLFTFYRMPQLFGIEFRCSGQSSNILKLNKDLGNKFQVL